MKKLFRFGVLPILLGVLVLGGILIPSITHTTTLQAGTFADMDNAFVRDATSLMAENWQDSYFSEITMTLNENKMSVDGEEIECEPAMLENDELLLPIIDIAEVIGAEVFAENNLDDITFIYDNTVTRLKKRHSRKRHATYKEVEDSLNLEISIRGNVVSLTNDYQTRQLLVRTLDKSVLKDTYGAVNVIADNGGFHLLQYSSERAARNALNKLKQNSRILYVEPNRIISNNAQIQEEIIPENELALEDRWGAERIRADEMKSYLIENEKVSRDLIVAVVDTGVDYTHPFLSARMSDHSGYDFINDDNDPFDDHGHGTHVSGTIVDCTTDNIRIMPVKVLSRNGSGSELEISLGVRHAADYGAEVINMSLSGTGGVLFGGTVGSTLQSAVDYAVDLNIVVVVAAGNDSKDTKNYFPAKFANVITVSATDSSDNIAKFSNFGDAVDIAAPGVDILSAWPNDRYHVASGTSMATPHVTAGVAMLKLYMPVTATPEELKTAVTNTVVDCGIVGKDRIFGAGVLDFRILLEHPSVDATDFTMTVNNIITTVFANEDGEIHENSIELNLLGLKVFPVEATNKSINISSNDPTIAEVINDRIHVRGIGTATITIALHNSAANLQFTVTIIDGNLTVEYTPNAKIDYINETLTNLIGGGTYRLVLWDMTYIEWTQDDEITTRSIVEEMMGWCKLIRVGNGITTRDSFAQDLRLSRPAAPKAYSLNPGQFGESGFIVFVDFLPNKFEWRISGGTWADVETLSMYLSPGTYEARVKATETNFAGNIAIIVIEEYVGIPTAAPTNIRLEESSYWDTTYVRWDVTNTSGVAGFAIYANETIIGETQGNSSRLFNINSRNPALTPGVQYEIRVRAIAWSNTHLDSELSTSYVIFQLAQIPTITMQPVGANVNYNSASPTLTVEVDPITDGGILSFQWYRNTTNSTIGMTTISGATNSSYNVPTSSIGTLYYFVIVTNTNNLTGVTQILTTTSDIVAVTINEVINAQTPNINTQPIGATDNAGSTISLTVEANVTDGGTLTYQWYWNTSNSTIGGTLISGATSASYNVSTTTVGTSYYYVIVTNTNVTATENKTAIKASSVVAVTINANAGATIEETPAIASKTRNSITINAVDVSANGQVIEYAISQNQTVPITGWQTNLTFTGLDADTEYYVFARAKANDQYKAGDAVITQAIKTNEVSFWENNQPIVIGIGAGVVGLISLSITVTMIRKKKIKAHK